MIAEGPIFQLVVVQVCLFVHNHCLFSLTIGILNLQKYELSTGVILVSVTLNSSLCKNPKYFDSNHFEFVAFFTTICRKFHQKKV